MTAPLLSVPARHAASKAMLIRYALCAGGVAVAAAGFLIPRFIGELPWFMPYIFLYVAVTDVGIGFFLSGSMLKRESGTLDFYPDRLDIRRAGGDVKQVPYSDIVSVTPRQPHEKDTARGLVPVEFTFSSPVSFHGGKSPARKAIVALPALEAPYEKIASITGKPQEGLSAA